MLPFVCRLTEKVMRSGKPVYIHTADAEQTHDLDQKLWTFSKGSFVPHDCWQAGHPATDTPVLIGHLEPPDEHHSVLINLANNVPPFFSRYERVLEIVDPANPDPGRQRFKYYKDRGYPLETHKIAA